MIKKLAWIIAIILLLVGVLGFIPAVAPNGQLFGFLEVDTVHNIIHLVTGLIFVYAAYASEKIAVLTFKVVGIIAAIVAVIGFAQGDTILGLVDVNTADNYFHLLSALVILYIGYFVKEEGSAHSMSGPSEMPSV